MTSPVFFQPFEALSPGTRLFTVKKEGERAGCDDSGMVLPEFVEVLRG